MKDCPACCIDVEHADPMLALALGSALGRSQGFEATTASLMCDAHRTAFILAALRAIQALEPTSRSEAS